MNGNVTTKSDLENNIDNNNDIESDITTAAPQKREVINAAGNTLETRILEPENYVRGNTKEGSLAEFLRKYPLKKHGSDVLLYDGSKKGNQNAHVAVLKLPIEERDL